jgi:hypothetical protein
MNFNSRTVHLDIIKVYFIYPPPPPPSEEQEKCFKSSIRTYIKTAPTFFGVNTTIRERTV